MSALDFPYYLDHADSHARFPISAPVSGDWPVEKLRHAVETLLGMGYNFIKVKVGRDFDSDAAAAKCILTEWPGKHFGVVFDSNQAHTVDAGLEFARILRECSSDRLQWYEQPVERSDWAGMEQLCRQGRVPIVLDECIYDEADVARAAAIGAYGVKLKLVKNFGITETLSLARKARALGLIVVFGNGVASDIGNLGEYVTLAAGNGIFAAPRVCCWFAILREPLLGSVLTIDQAGNFKAAASASALAKHISNFADLQPVAG
jgi:L-alanine-DL-glutamate epimerase-like enolase superfamily enzyme